MENSASRFSRPSTVMEKHIDHAVHAGITHRQFKHTADREQGMRSILRCFPQALCPRPPRGGVHRVLGQIKTHDRKARSGKFDAVVPLSATGIQQASPVDNEETLIIVNSELEANKAIA